MLLGNPTYCCSETVKEPAMEFDLRLKRCHTDAYSLRQTWQACSDCHSALAAIHHGKMATAVQINWHKCPCFFSARWLRTYRGANMAANNKTWWHCHAGGLPVRSSPEYLFSVTWSRARNHQRSRAELQSCFRALLRPARPTASPARGLGSQSEWVTARAPDTHMLILKHT